MKNSNLKRWLNPFFTELDEIIGHPKSLLDIGCGVNTPLSNLSIRPDYLVGVDGYQPSIDESRSKGLHDDYVNTDLLEIDSAFESNTFEAVVALDVIEHFDKPDGMALLNKMESIASHKVVIFTPNGFQPQNEHSGNKLQRHLSGWEVEEMHQLGYQVIGVNGWKPLLGEFALPRFKPTKLWTLFSRFTQPLVRNHPQHAYAILCVKDVSNSKI
ncbi:MAG: class I SAM-dependent methyltransferase [Candidatus Thiodiazotropha sp. (ex Monitilora ramsayi)]|nr:class I SAM-dependent methyltransferase [Candidatus Thiodiazotropha sp. (ex Monitilora ramsayi)]